jgi:hypothetical protein
VKRGEGRRGKGKWEAERMDKKEKREGGREMYSTVYLLFTMESMYTHVFMYMRVK